MNLEVKLRLCSSKNASNLQLGIFICSSAVPIRIPHTRKVEGHVPLMDGSGASDRLARQWIREMYYYELNAHSAASVLEVAKLSSHAAK